MAKKKSQQNPPKPVEFRTTPFSTLKGVAVATPPPPILPQPVETRKAPIADDTELFLQAMEDVKQLNGRTTLSAKASQQSLKPAATGRAITERHLEKERSDSEAFAQAIGQLKLDVTFCDQTPEDDEIKPLGANRLRQLKRGIVSVERQLDLHGLTREEALGALPRFLQSASAYGEKAVLVITGKGNNSPGEPVLQQAVVAWLRDAGKKLVVEFAPAPREMGGSGAFVVFLRG
ncbi:MAG: Smr/MutS family protein [Desulfuromonadales bacterium]|nr:Smr/MutS family protein [Desulfuromonadales bacterium]